MNNEKEIKALEKELARLQDLALDMYETKYSKKAEQNHKRITMIQKQIKRLIGENR